MVLDSVIPLIEVAGIIRIGGGGEVARGQREKTKKGESKNNKQTHTSTCTSSVTHTHTRGGEATSFGARFA